jgi:hypothetical protein
MSNLLQPASNGEGGVPLGAGQVSVLGCATEVRQSDVAAGRVHCNTTRATSVAGAINSLGQMKDQRAISPRG